MEDIGFAFIAVIFIICVLLMAGGAGYIIGSDKLRNCAGGDNVMHNSVVYECTPVFELERR